MLFSEFVNRYVALHLHAIRESTYRRVCRSSFNSFLRICGDRDLDKYTVRDIEIFKSERLKTTTPTTVNISFRTLKAAFNLAVKWQMATQNPFLKSSQLPVVQKAKKFITKDEFYKLFSTIEEKWFQEIVVFTVLTGLRRGEVTNLCWIDVDLENRRIFVRNTTTFTNKTGKDRVIAMNNLLVALFQKKKRIGDYVFTVSGQKIADSWITHLFKKYVRRAKLEDTIHFHSLRHTFASWLVQDGVSLYEIQKLLGHSSLTVTQMYSHLQPEMLHNTVNRIKLNLPQDRILLEEKYKSTECQHKTTHPPGNSDG